MGTRGERYHKLAEGQPARNAFLESLRMGTSIQGAAEAAGITRQGAYAYRREHEEFKEAWDDAVECGTDRLEDEAHRRAHDGTEKPVYQGGELVGYVREYSDTLMIFMLKGRRPQKYKDRVALGGDEDGPPLRQVTREMSGQEAAEAYHAMISGGIPKA